MRFGAGNTVRLYPVTSLTTEWFEKLVLQSRPLGAGDPHIEDHSQTTVADGNGNFEFSGLPSGSYYLVCGITWLAGDQLTGGTAYAKVSVSSGSTAKAIVTR